MAIQKKMSETNENPANRENNRNPDGTFKTGMSGNPSGRPKNTMKDYVRIKFSAMTDEQKENWLKENRISGIDQWKMGEGNPQNDITSGGEPIVMNVIKYEDNNDSIPIQP